MILTFKFKIDNHSAFCVVNIALNFSLNMIIKKEGGKKGNTLMKSVEA